jgi:metal-responsive CopG/Arc/MetJ family transcriptional regulator
MKVKTSLSLSPDLLAELDELAGPDVSRSSYIEQVLRDFVDGLRRAQREARDIELIKKHAAELNAEALDVLSYQADVFGPSDK